MPRQGRIHIDGGIYHVIARGIERRVIFKDDRDRSEFIRRLAMGLKKTQIQCHAWALLSNHFHLLLIPSQKPISQLMHSLLTGYSVYFNLRHKRVGHLFQNRYRSILCQKENYYLKLLQYIHLNPLIAGMVESVHELATYPWTGHAAVLGKTKHDWYATAEVLGRFGSNRGAAIREYVDFIHRADGMKDDGNLEGGGLIRSVGGWQGLGELKKAREIWNKDERILGDGQFVEEILDRSKCRLNSPEVLKRNGWTLDKLAVKLCEQLRVEKKMIFKKCRVHPAKEARALVAYLGKTVLRVPTKELALYLSVAPSGITYLVQKGEDLNNKVDVNWLF